ncbi:MAG: response regulator [Gammaproteobacteria bacterium]|nr:MAG: response regulator [Gammaproteobacteria bacterium]
MKQDDTIEYNALGWVKKELDAVLTQARQALEAFIEDEEATDRLQECRTLVRQAQGTLQMVELFGAAMLAEEMTELLDAIEAGRVRNREDAYEALMRALIQMPDYLEHIQAGNRDVPIALLPLMNDLRAARDVPLLSENVLFFPEVDARAEEAEAPETEAPGQPPERDVRAAARALRHSYQLGLLGVLRDRDVAKSLRTMHAVLERLRRFSTLPGSRRLWWIAGALTDALAREGLEGGVTVKQLLGRVDRQIRQLVEQGEEGMVQNLPNELIKNLLYYIATSETVSDQVKAVKKAYRLSDMLPSGQDVREMAGAEIGGLNLEVLQTVSQGIREDLTEIKDVLELFVHADNPDTAELLPLADKLRTVADTLTMLGLGEARELVLTEEARVRAMGEGQSDVDENALLEVAGIMLNVEAILNDFIASRSQGGSQRALDRVAEAADGGHELPEAEYRETLRALIRETLTEMNRAKEAIVEFISLPTETRPLEEVPGILRSVRGAMSILPLERLMPVLDSLAAYIEREVLGTRQVPDNPQLEAMADAITAVEMYLEGLAEGQGQLARYIDVAEEAVAALGYPAGAIPPQESPVPAQEAQPAEGMETVETLAVDLADMETVELEQPVTEPEPEVADLEERPTTEVQALDAAESAPTLEVVAPEGTEEEPERLGDETLETLQLDSLLETQEGEVAPEAEAGGEPEHAPAPASEAPQAPAAESLPDGSEFRDLQPLAGEIDDEILEIFLEEAEEEIERIGEYLPRWKADPADEEALTTIRRSFHTLKGSGRLVGAQLIGEFAWAFENMLNRVIDKTIPAEPHVFEALEEAHQALGELVRQVRDKVQPGMDVHGLMARAHEMSKPGYAERYLGGSTEAEESEADLTAFIDEEPAAAPNEETAAAEAGETVAETADEQAAEVPEAVEDETVAPTEVINMPPGAGPEGRIAESREPETVEEEVIDLTLEVPSPVMFDSGESEATGAGIEVEEGAGDEEQIVLTGEFPELADLDSGSGEDKEEVLLEEPAEPAVAEEEEEEVPTVIAPVLEQGARIDPVLLEIFSNETRQHLDTLRQILAETPEGAELPADDRMIRALHTLNGSARTASVPEISALSGPFEKYAKACQNEGQGMSPQARPLLERMVSFIEEVLESLASPAQAVPTAEDVQRQIEALLAEVETGGEQPTVMMEIRQDLAEQVSAAEAGEAAAEVQAGEPDVVSEEDMELVEIFIEEAEEILDAADGTLARWQEAPDDQEVIQEIQRQLHTLKGGARMANFTNIGDLSHAFESLIIKIAEGIVSPTPEMFGVLHETLDKLSNMVEQAKAGEPVYPEPELIRRVEALESGQPAPSAGTAQAEEAAPAEPSFEAEGEAAPEALEVAETVVLKRPEPGAFEPPTVPGADETPVRPSSLDTLEAAPTEELPLPDFARPSEAPSAPAEKEPKGEPPGKKSQTRPGGQEVIRVRSDLLDNLVNFAGEVNIYHARLEEQITTFGFNLQEFEQTIERLREQLRKLELETEAQVLANFEREKAEGNIPEDEEFDPLEMDRYSTIQQLSRALAESVNDLLSIQQVLSEQVRDTETLMLQQSRVSTELQEGLMRTRMVQFGSISPRLRRVVRQTAAELGKKVELEIRGEHSELDRSVLEHMVAPLEHMLRNAISHGIETPQERAAKGKPESGHITLDVHREGSEIVIDVTDDGAGIDLDKVRAKARQLGIAGDVDKLSDEDAMQLILESGFSTADKVSQISGRGVGMDVVNNEIKQLGGVLHIESHRGKGTHFRVNLPFTLAINQALLVQTGEDIYAVPLQSIEGIVRMSAGELATRYDESNPTIEYAAYDYELKHLGALLGTASPQLDDPGQLYPVLLVISGGHRLALQVEGLLGSREVVVKSVGPQLAKVRGISGATILGDGRVVLILDVPSLVRMSAGVKLVYTAEEEEAAAAEAERKPLVMVVDDSITIRKVTSRMLERNDFDVITAKDGVDAIANLHEERLPDIMLLDIEMPRMDGYELATHIRNDERLRDIPIIMITSRTGEKHRQRAMDIGVNRYLGKPYQESELLEEINGLLAETGAVKQA